MATETPVLNTKVDEKTKQPEQFTPSNVESNVTSRVFQLFRDSADERNQSWEYFDQRTLVEYISDSSLRYYTNINERDNIEDWQARVHDPHTRNKTVAILSKVANNLPEIEFLGRNVQDFRKERILTDLYQYAEDADDSREFLTFALLEALVKGTMVGFEGYEEKTKSVREVSNWDGGDTISLRDGKVIVRKVRSFIVPLEDFYPSSVGIRKIKEMPYCFWRSVIPYSQFLMEFAQYEKAKFVQPYQTQSGETSEEEPIYRDYISSNVSEGNVEVIRYYNQDTDEFVLLANGIWLNPILDEKVMPIPYNHKKLPFWSAVYEPFGADFFYGKSVPDKLKAYQDVTDALMNMLLDQSFLSIFPPLLVAGLDEIEDDFLRPGRRISVTDPSNYQTLNIPTPGGWHQFITQYIKRIMEETSLDAVQSGQAGSGDRVTATEIERASQAVASLLGLFVKFVSWGLKDRARLRAQNIIQFYSKPMLEAVLGEGASKDIGKAFNTFKMRDVILTSGKRGTKIIEMFQEKKDLPTKEAQKIKAVIDEKETKVKTERTALLPGYMRNFEFDIRMVAAFNSEKSKAQEQALALEKAKIYMEIGGEFVDRREILADIAEKFGDDPKRFIKKDAFAPEEEKPNTGTGVAENIVKQTAGNDSVAAGLRQLTQ